MERDRLAREIHDSVLQNMVCNSLKLGAMVSKRKDEIALVTPLNDVILENQKCITDLRNICSDLLPSDLEHSNF